MTGGSARTKGGQSVKFAIPHPGDTSSAAPRSSSSEGVRLAGGATSTDLAYDPYARWCRVAALRRFAGWKSRRAAAAVLWTWLGTVLAVIAATWTGHSHWALVPLGGAAACIAVQHRASGLAERATAALNLLQAPGIYDNATCGCACCLGRLHEAEHVAGRIGYGGPEGSQAQPKRANTEH